MVIVLLLLPSYCYPFFSMDNIQSCEFTAEVESKCKQPVQTIYSRSRTRKAALVFVVTHDVKRSPAHIISYNLPSFSHTLSNSKNAVSW